MLPAVSSALVINWAPLVLVSQPPVRVALETGKKLRAISVVLPKVRSAINGVPSLQSAMRVAFVFTPGPVTREDRVPPLKLATPASSGLPGTYMVPSVYGPPPD